MAIHLTDSPSRQSILWQDTLLKVSQSVLQQRTVDDLLQVLQGASFSVVRFQRVHLLWFNPLHNQIRFYRYDPLTDKVTSSEEGALLAEGPGSASWTYTTLQRCDRLHFLRDYPYLAQHPAYLGLSDYCLVPLVRTGADRVMGGLAFLKTDGSLFDDSEIAFFQALASIVTCALENIMTREQAQKETESLRHERDHYRILVDVTNTVISKLELKALAQEVSREIHRFFGIDFIALALGDGENEDGPLTYYATHYPAGESPTGKTSYHKQGKVARTEMLAAQVMQNNAVVLSAPGDGTPGTPARCTLAQRLDGGLTHACLLPLTFGTRVLGVLELAHRHELAVTEADIRLLRQIAARIAIALDNAVAYEQITRLKDSLIHENFYLTEQLTEHVRQHGDDAFGEIIGCSQAIRQVLEQVEMVAASDSTVLILGETGTGKELIARAIHRLSPRQGKRMVKMNCAAIPSGLLESDLFGHEKGAFTGASAQRQGRFELADNSTLFLDEVGDIPPELQPKLLRVLQEREIERLGGSKVISVDVRLIAATNRDLKQMVADREYRSDLYYRLNVFPIVIPPLRERPEDIPLLVTFFTRKIARRMNRTIDNIPSEVLRRLSRLPWPGNVRELENVVERAVILTRGTTLNLQLAEFQQMPPSASDVQKSVAAPQNMPSRQPLQDDEVESERQKVIRVLRETNGIVAGPKGAAARMGVKRTTLLSRMQRMGISVKDIADMA